MSSSENSAKPGARAWQFRVVLPPTGNPSWAPGTPRPPSLPRNPIACIFVPDGRQKWEQLAVFDSGWITTFKGGALFFPESTQHDSCIVRAKHKKSKPNAGYAWHSSHVEYLGESALAEGPGIYSLPMGIPNDRFGDRIVHFGAENVRGDYTALRFGIIYFSIPMPIPLPADRYARVYAVEEAKPDAPMWGDPLTGVTVQPPGGKLG